mmetsp:Transcript_17917/g.45820  ORF Transcript_17917/g.45820 Transcript_17917/m.45820 type:complete len:202 (-) Transcript_17917:190-795(-)|eukprot:CAMPEP_0115858734 /NCGR_PEP_ID=MMETSP0287-20121206/16251_1 /TAXON_ID=412157 /ORGANISM="Chrysochromulina rotalis, Strain UIO044" /LENGTH=201 /DNA_ID=CAMNT_0003313009 /DNA_START=30 /DNA_END=635 /DNA_ORIENTATION=+
MADYDGAGGKRKRAAPTRHGEYLDEQEADDIDAPPKRERGPPKPKPPQELKQPPAPKIKLTVTAPIRKLTTEEQSLMAKYAELRTLLEASRERGASTDALAEEIKPASFKETEMALAELAKLQESDVALISMPRAAPSRRGQSKRAQEHPQGEASPAPQPEHQSAFSGATSGKSEGEAKGGGYGDADSDSDDIKYAADEYD